MARKERVKSTYIGAKNTKNEITFPVHQINKAEYINLFAKHKIHSISI